jgi:hypothetical protein
VAVLLQPTPINILGLTHQLTKNLKISAFRFLNHDGQHLLPFFAFN